MVREKLNSEIIDYIESIDRERVFRGKIADEDWNEFIKVMRDGMESILPAFNCSVNADGQVQVQVSMQPFATALKKELNDPLILVIKEGLKDFLPNDDKDTNILSTDFMTEEELDEKMGKFYKKGDEKKEEKPLLNEADREKLKSTSTEVMRNYFREGFREEFAKANGGLVNVTAVEALLAKAMDAVTCTVNDSGKIQVQFAINTYAEKFGVKPDDKEIQDLIDNSKKQFPTVDANTNVMSTNFMTEDELQETFAVKKEDGKKEAEKPDITPLRTTKILTGRESSQKGSYQDPGIQVIMKGGKYFDSDSKEEITPEEVKKRNKDRDERLAEEKEDVKKKGTDAPTTMEEVKARLKSLEKLDSKDFYNHFIEMDTDYTEPLGATNVEKKWMVKMNAAIENVKLTLKDINKNPAAMDNYKKAQDMFKDLPVYSPENTSIYTELTTENPFSLDRSDNAFLLRHNECVMLVKALALAQVTTKGRDEIFKNLVALPIPVSPKFIEKLGTYKLFDGVVLETNNVGISDLIVDTSIFTTKNNNPIVGSIFGEINTFEIRKAGEVLTLKNKDEVMIISELDDGSIQLSHRLGTGKPVVETFKKKEEKEEGGKKN